MIKEGRASDDICLELEELLSDFAFLKSATLVEALGCLLNRVPAQQILVALYLVISGTVLGVELFLAVGFFLKFL